MYVYITFPSVLRVENSGWARMEQGEEEGGRLKVIVA